jgi:hypothetical protein
MGTVGTAPPDRRTGSDTEQSGLWINSKLHLLYCKCVAGLLTKLVPNLQFACCYPIILHCERKTLRDTDSYTVVYPGPVSSHLRNSLGFQDGLIRNCKSDCRILHLYHSLTQSSFCKSCSWYSVIQHDNGFYFV